MLGLMSLLVGCARLDIPSLPVTLTVDTPHIPHVENGLIVFSARKRYNTDLYTMQPDWTQLQRLTNYPGDDLWPQWIANGSYIVYKQGQALFRIRPDGTSAESLHSIQTRSLNELSWSPDGKSIAFTSDYRNQCNTPFEGLAIADADGTGIRCVTSSRYGHMTHFIWSPDGTQIAFTVNEQGESDIFVVDADGSNERRLTDDKFDDALLDWMPDGKGVLFMSFGRYKKREEWGHAIYGRGMLYRVNDDGSDVQLAIEPTHEKEQAFLLNFSADRTRVLVEIRTADTDYLVVADAMTFAPIYTLYEDEFAFSQPVLSPDGQKILFKGDQETYYMMNADGTDQRKLDLPSPLEDMRNPAWEPVWK